MRYIPKNNNNAIEFVEQFLNKNWLEQNDGSYRYQNIEFSDVKNPVADFREFFVEEQSKKCCYCCRNIKNDNTTELEHIIPRSKSQADFQPYYDLSTVLAVNVVGQESFVNITSTSSQSPLPLPPFPHHVAYHNIVASCNGRTFKSSSLESFTCCNRERKDDFVPPFNLIEESVKYLKDGTIVSCIDLSDVKSFSILNLNKKILKDIRRLWFLFSRSDLRLDEVLNFNDYEELGEFITTRAIGSSDDLTEDLRLVGNFQLEGSWKVFIEFEYFFNYYRNQP